MTQPKRSVEEELDARIQQTTTYPVLNRRTLVFGMESGHFYPLLASGVFVYSRTNSVMAALAYLITAILGFRMLVRKDPDAPLYLWWYCRAARHFDAGKIRRFDLKVIRAS